MDEAAKVIPHMMGVAGDPVTECAMLSATGSIAGRSLVVGALLCNPLVFVAAGLVAGFYLHKHQAEIALALSKAGGLGKGFLLQQKERLADLVEEAKEKEGQQASTAKPEQAPG